MQIDFMLTVQKVSILFLLIVIGYIAGRMQLISENGQKDITQLVLYITMPATIFSAMQLEMNSERLQTAVTITFIMLLCYILMFIAGTIISKFLSIPDNKIDVFKTSLLLSNTSFMGYPIIQSLLGNEALFYSVVGAGFIFEIISWSLGVYLISRHGSQSSSFDWRKVLISPGIISILIGFIFFVFQLDVLEPFQSVINTLSPATSPLAMIVIGLMLSRSNVRDAFSNKVIYLSVILKLFIIPLFITLLLKLLGFNDATLIIPVMMISMPTASYVAMFSANYGNDEKFASQIVFLSSLFSMVSIPIITLLF